MIPQNTIQSLLESLFDSREFYRLLYGFTPRGVPEGKDLLDNLKQPEDTSEKDFFFSVTRGLIQRNMIDAGFFELLTKARSSDLSVSRIDHVRKSVLPHPSPPTHSSSASALSSANPFAPFATFVGRQEELKVTRQMLREGRAAVLIAGRRAGKTALLSQIGDIGVPRVYLDVAAWELTDLSSAFRCIGAALGEHCLSRADVEVVIKRQAPIALIIDEADRLLGRPWTHELFIWLRHLNDTRFRTQLSFLLVGGPGLWRYRNPDDNGSPALNTAQWIFLEPLSLAACKMLIDALGHSIDETLLLSEAGGHPWLLTEILRRVWDGASLEDAIARVAEEGQQNFETWRDQLGEPGVALVRLLAGGGVPQADLRYRGRLWRRHGRVWPLVRSLSLAERITDPIPPGPGMFLYWLGEGQ